MTDSNHDAEDDAYRRGYNFGVVDMRERCAAEAESWEFPGARDPELPANIAAAIRDLKVE